MRNRKITKLVQLAAPLVLMAAIATPAHAYVGPGAGVSLFGAAIGLVIAVFSALGVIVMWPIRVLAKKLRRVRSETKRSDQPVAAK